MASGSNAPFSGDFVDLENVPKLPQGISAEQVLNQNSDVVRQVAEARFKSGLSQVNADGGFFDAFVNQNKILSKSSTSISTGINGNGKLARSFALFEGFEGASISDSDITVTSGQSSDASIISGSGVISGNNALELSPNGDFLQVELDSPSQSNPIVAAKIKPQTFPTGNSSDYILFNLRDDGNFSSRIVVLHGDGDISVGSNQFKSSNTVVGSYSSNDVIDFTINLSSSEAIFIVNGNKTKTSLSNFDTADFIRCECNTFSSGVNANAVYDKIQTSDSLKKSGSVTHSQFTFTDTQGNSFSPSKVGVFPDQTLNGQSISYDLKDSTGTVVKTFNQSDLNQLQSVNTTDDTFQVEANFSGNGSQTPELEFLDVRGV